ncbi:hypothetical protein [Nonomuraea sp. NPDC052265]
MVIYLDGRPTLSPRRRRVQGPGARSLNVTQLGSFRDMDVIGT